MNIFSYAKNKNEPFAESPFNFVDALILCWLSFYTYPDYLKEESVILKNAAARGLLPDKQMYRETFNPRTSKKLFNCLAQSERFRDIELSDFREEWDEVNEKQFAALCIKLSPDEYFLSFRGTDPSFTGWKEDMNLACRYPVPSQLAAAEYMREVMRKYPKGKFWLGGHSKGGNVAVYAAVTAEESLQNAIIKVINFDGPGFINDIYSGQGFKSVEHKIIKIVPNSSFVGMLLETRTSYSVIASRNPGVLQHDPFSWKVAGDDFKYVSARTHSSVRIERAMNLWIKEIPPDERERVIDLIYGALNTLDTRSFIVFFKTFYRQIPALYFHYRRLNPEDKNFFNTKIKRLQKLINGA